MARKLNMSNLWKRYSDISQKVRRNIRYLEKHNPSSIALERYGLSEFPTMTQLKKEGYDPRSLQRLTNYARKALEQTQPSTVKRAERLAIETIRNDYGVKYINGRNINAFFRFMDDLRARGVATAKSSKVWAETYEKIRKQGLSKSEIQLNMDYWLQEFEKLSTEGRAEDFSPDIIRKYSSGYFK